MGDFSQSVTTAISLIRQADAALMRTVLLSLGVSGAACALAGVFGLLGGAWLAVARFPGHRLLVLLLNTLLALPSVVVGLTVYLLLSRSGPLGSWGILFTPAAMVIAQTLLVLPIVAALSRQLVADSLRDGGDQLAGQRRDHRQHQQRLREDHRGGREQQPPAAERPAARQQQVDHARPRSLARRTSPGGRTLRAHRP